MTTNFDPTTMPADRFYYLQNKDTDYVTEYIRADLTIPRADVMELVKALKDSLDYMVGDGFHCDVEIKQAKQALANFNQKYGQLTKSPENVTCADLTNAADSSQNIEHTGE